MGEFIRRLIRWIIFIIIVVLLILLIIKLANKNGANKKTKEVIDKSVKTIKKNTTDSKTTTKSETSEKSEEKDVEETTDDSIVTSTLEVNTPDTSSNSYLYILGVMITGSGVYYIYKNRKVND